MCIYTYVYIYIYICICIYIYICAKNIRKAGCEPVCFGGLWATYTSSTYLKAQACNIPSRLFLSVYISSIFFPDVLAWRSICFSDGRVEVRVLWLHLGSQLWETGKNKTKEKSRRSLGFCQMFLIWLFLFVFSWFSGAGRGSCYITWGGGQALFSGGGPDFVYFLEGVALFF